MSQYQRIIEIIKEMKKDIERFKTEWVFFLVVNYLLLTVILVVFL